MNSVQKCYHGCLLGPAPVPMFFAGDPRKAIEKSGESSRTTHGARAAMDAAGISQH